MHVQLGARLSSTCTSLATVERSPAATDVQSVGSGAACMVRGGGVGGGGSPGREGGREAGKEVKGGEWDVQYGGACD